MTNIQHTTVNMADLTLSPYSLEPRLHLITLTHLAGAPVGMSRLNPEETFLPPEALNIENSRISESLYSAESTMAVPKITLYVDIVSPFAYIGFHVLKARPSPA